MPLAPEPEPASRAPAPPCCERFRCPARASAIAEVSDWSGPARSYFAPWPVHFGSPAVRALEWRPVPQARAGDCKSPVRCRGRTLRCSVGCARARYRPAAPLPPAGPGWPRPLAENFGPRPALLPHRHWRARQSSGLCLQPIPWSPAVPEWARKFSPPPRPDSEDRACPAPESARSDQPFSLPPFGLPPAAPVSFPPRWIRKRYRAAPAPPPAYKDLACRTQNRAPAAFSRPPRDAAERKGARVSLPGSHLQSGARHMVIENHRVVSDFRAGQRVLRVHYLQGGGFAGIVAQTGQPQALAREFGFPLSLGHLFDRQFDIVPLGVESAGKISQRDLPVDHHLITRVFSLPLTAPRVAPIKKDKTQRRGNGKSTVGDAHVRGVNAIVVFKIESRAPLAAGQARLGAGRLFAGIKQRKFAAPLDHAHVPVEIILFSRDLEKRVGDIRRLRQVAAPKTLETNARIDRFVLRRIEVAAPRR